VKRLLLDTEALIWWDANDRRLSGRARAAIQQADEVYVSAASAWEIVIKESIGKLRTTRRPAQVLEDAGFLELPIGIEHTEALRELPNHHRDPFDRLILATAKVESLTIVSSDRQFTLYDVPLIDARN
jgi:PIN domain nuclease of toxin-antitoxin system